jgi:hypothetical protein
MIAEALTRLPARTAPNVPHEFAGQARLFCARIDAAAQAASVAVRQIGGDARAIVQRRSTWRREHLSGFERQWRQTIPDEGRIGLEVERGKGSLIISEFRLSRASYEDIRWSQPFPQNSVCLMLCTFRLATPAAFECKRLAIAALGIHALARRYQRGFDNTDHAIKTDISDLALNFSRLLGAESQTFAIPCHSGQWVGAIETVRLSSGPDQRLLHVRSFLHHEGSR